MKTEKAYFGMGCFWGPQAFFDELPGVVSTRVGYAGGTTKDPTYQTIGDHTETTEVTFDPAKISYGDLLQRFWQKHDPYLPEKPQYQSAIFTVDAAQATAARKSLDDAAESSGRKPTTRIEPLPSFTEAEEYHQKYYEKNRL